MTLEDKVDEELRRGENDVESERAPCEAGAEEQGAEEPEEAVEEGGCDEGLVEAARVGCGEGFDCFLDRFVNGVRLNRGIGMCYLRHGD